LRFLENEKRICANFFQGSGENTCSLQPALKNTAPGLEIYSISLCHLPTRDVVSLTDYSRFNDILASLWLV